MAKISIADRLLRNRHWLDQFAGGIHQQLSNELKDAQKTLIEQLMKPGLDKLTAKHHKKLLAEVTQILEDAYGEYPDIIGSGMIDAAKHEYYDVVNALRDISGRKKIAKSAPNQGLPAEAIKQINTMPIGGSLLEDWVEKQYVNAKTGIRSVLNQSLIRGLGMGETAKMMRDRIGMSMNEAMVLSRTSIMEASNRALDRAYADNEDIIDDYTWLATLDNSTCVVCGSLDGKIYKTIDDAPPRPAHMQCRCLLKPNIKLEGLEEAQRFAVERDPDTGRIISKERVHGKTKYQAWFDDQDENFQRQVLGKTRYELYTSDKLTLRQMSDANAGRVLTLEQLDKKYDLNLKEEIQ